MKFLKSFFAPHSCDHPMGKGWYSYCLRPYCHEIQRMKHGNLYPKPMGVLDILKEIEIFSQQK